MKKKYLIILGICMFLILPQVTNACWAYLTIDELVEKSDIILIGEVTDRLGRPTTIENIHYNKWKVKVHYYIKGATNDSDIIVGTPDERTSLHYDLNAQGNQVLLFLRKSGNYYLPHSPQAVVSIAFTKDDKTEMKNEISGEELLEFIKITDQNVNPEEKGKLEEYLSNRELIKGVEETVGGNGIQTATLVFAGLPVMGALSILFLIIRKK